jgi:hypothetical protein
MNGTVNLRWLGIFVGAPCDERTELHSSADLAIGPSPSRLPTFSSAASPGCPSAASVGPRSHRF